MMTKVDGLVRKILNELEALGTGYARVSLYMNGPATKKQARKVLGRVTDLAPIEGDDWVEAAKKDECGKYEVTIFYGGMEA